MIWSVNSVPELKHLPKEERSVVWREAYCRVRRRVEFWASLLPIPLLMFCTMLTTKFAGGSNKLFPLHLLQRLRGLLDTWAS